MIAATEAAIDIKQQAEALVELARIKCDLTNAHEGMKPYREMLVKLSKPGELFTSEESEQVSGFKKAIIKLAEATQKESEWYRTNDVNGLRQAIAPVLPESTSVVSEKTALDTEAEDLPM